MYPGLTCHVEHITSVIPNYLQHSVVYMLPKDLVENALAPSRLDYCDTRLLIHSEHHLTVYLSLTLQTIPFSSLVYLLNYLNMPASDNRDFYALLDSIAQSVGDEDAVQQNKRIKEEQFAQDSAEPDEAQTAAIRREVEAGKHHTSLATSASNNPHRP